MFGQLGGTYSVIFSIGAIFVGVFSSQIYMNSLLSSFYRVFKDKPSLIYPNKRIEESKEMPLQVISKFSEMSVDSFDHSNTIIIYIF